ncbi:MAG: hypothetical protein PHZ07_00535 [Patescibacteria group bacterium]|nr:hypothetical protein [Patescibacteria group bacterium]MDD4304209.1 hypothetical protein [Patescibacteria group bacterium]MDD4695242.1 hypothetical protein [Patescibacteria group bacterium]
MPDINLLPEDLKKKNNNSFKKKNDFNSREVEFTSGVSLKKDSEDDEIDAVDKLFSWMKPKMDEKNNTNLGSVNIPQKQNLINNKVPEIQERPYTIKSDKLKKDKIVKVKENKRNFFSKLFSQKQKNKNIKNIKKEIPINDNKKNYLGSNNFINEKTFNSDGNLSINKPLVGGVKSSNISNISTQKISNDSNIQKNIVSDIQLKNIVNTKDISESKINNKVITNNKKESPNSPKKSKFSLKSIFSSKKKNKNFSMLDQNNDLGVNLLPEGINTPSAKNLIFVLLSTFIVSCMIVVVAYFALNIYEIKLVDKYKDINVEAGSYKSSLDSYDTLISEIQSWQTKIDKIRTLFSHHVYWTKFFETVEANTLSDIIFSSFTGSVNGNLTLNAQAPNYETVVKQWNYWNGADKFVDKVIISGASLSSNGTSQIVNFSVTFDFVDNIFYKTDKLEENKQNE